MHPTPADRESPETPVTPCFWLQPGVDDASVRAMFEAVCLFTTTFAWYTLCGQETVRVWFPVRGETLHLRLETRYECPGRLRLALHIARDVDTCAAWCEGVIGDTQITIVGVRRHELPNEAILELRRLGRERYELYPKVMVGLHKRPPTPDEWHLAVRALEAFDLLYDPHQGSADGVQARMLASGETIVLEVGEPEYEAFPVNDGGVLVSYFGPDEHVASLGAV